MIILQLVLITYLAMRSISRTVYPDGRVNEYQNGAFIKLNQAPNTKEFNNWINFIYNYAIR
jgi:hypothetical protein